MFEQLVLCYAAQPDLDAKVLAMAARSQGIPLQFAMQATESGSEGRNNAFRIAPCHPGDQHVNVTGMFDPTSFK